MIDKFIYGFIDRVYGAEDYTQQEINAKLIQKLDEVIENCNNAFEFMDYIKGQGLTDEVINTLLSWKEDGTLEKLINQELNEMIKDIRTEINNINNFKEEVNTKLIEINNEINEIKNKINSSQSSSNTV